MSLFASGMGGSRHKQSIIEGLPRNLFKDIGSFIGIRQNTMNSRQRPVAIVTGASSGIGLGIALALIEHGYPVVGTSRAISKSKELKASADLVLIDGDISKKETAVKVAEVAIKHFGRIDLLVSCQAIHRVHRGRL